MSSSNYRAPLRNTSTKTKCSRFLLMLGSVRYPIVGDSAIEAIIFFLADYANVVSCETLLRLVVWNEVEGSKRLSEVLATANQGDLIGLIAFAYQAKEGGLKARSGVLDLLIVESKKYLHENFDFSCFKTLHVQQNHVFKSNYWVWIRFFGVAVIRLIDARKMLSDCGFYSCLFSVDALLGGNVSMLEVAGIDLLDVSTDMRIAGCLASDCDIVETLGNDMIALAGGQTWERV